MIVVTDSETYNYTFKNAYSPSYSWENFYKEDRKKKGLINGCTIFGIHPHPAHQKNVLGNYQLAIVGRVGNYTEGASGQTEGSSPSGTPLETLKYRPRAPHQPMVLRDKDCDV